MGQSLECVVGVTHWRYRYRTVDPGGECEGAGGGTWNGWNHAEPTDRARSHFASWRHFVPSCPILLSILANIFGQNLGCKARKILHKNLLEHIMIVKPYLFEMLPPSRFISRLAQDIFIIDQKLPSSVQRMSLVAFICLGAIIVNAIQSPIFLAFACPLILFYWAIQHFYRRSSIELQRIESATRSPYLSHLSNTLCSLVTLRAFKEETLTWK